MFNVNGKRVFISGGTRGIGRALAESLSSHGAEVSVSGRSGAGAPNGVSAYACDQSDEASVESTLAEITNRSGPLDTLIVNAGVTDAAAPLSMTDCDAFEVAWRTNTRGVAHFLKHAGEVLADAASIIVTSTPAANMVFPGYVAYGASKSGIDILVKHAAMEYGARGVRANIVNPGTILTDMQPEDDDEARICQTATCLRRMGRVDDLFGAYHFLASDASRYVTATTITVDGGWLGGVTETAARRLAGE